MNATLSLYYDGIHNKLMHEDSVKGILREMTLDETCVTERESNPEWGENAYKLDIPPSVYPALVKRLQGRFVIVYIDSRNFLYWWSFGMGHYWDEAWADFTKENFPWWEDDLMGLTVWFSYETPIALSESDM